MAERLLADRGHVVVRDPSAPADMLVVDEWTSETDAAVLAARAEGIMVTVLAEMILDDLPHPVVGVTGTAGKTSTCRALEQILRACGRPVAISATARSGNAWPDHSLVDQLAVAEADTVVIAELTSTHLCHMSSVHPDVAVVTTIRPDHVELHGGIEAYVAAKRRLVAELAADDRVVLPTDDPETIRLLGPVEGQRWGFGGVNTGPGAYAVDGGALLVSTGAEAYVPTALEGPLLRCGLAAASAALALGIDADEVGAGLREIRPVGHRQAPRRGPRGITIVDDTMAATPVKVRAAIERFGGPGLVLVLGGDDALAGAPVHSSPEEEAMLAETLALARQRTATIVAFGPARRRILPHLAVDVGADDIDAALAIAIDACPDGGTVLVSPMFPLTPAEREVAAGPA